MKEENHDEFGADAAEKKTTEIHSEMKEEQAQLDETMNELDTQEQPTIKSPKKDRQELVKATKELLEYQDSIFKEDEEVTMIKISRND